MLTATSRIVRAHLASVFIPLVLLGIDASPLRAQGATQSATADSSRCDPIDADRPGIADGSHVIDVGQLQLETGYLQERHPEGDVRRRLSFVPTLLRIGLASRVEARLEGNTFSHERASAADGSTTARSGVSPLFLGAKILLSDPEQNGTLSVATIIRVAPPSGTDEFSTHRVTGDVRVVANWQFTPTLSLNPNVGYASNEGSDGTRFGTALGALTLSWQATSRWNPFVDVAYASREDAGGSWSMIGDAGVAYILDCDVQLDFSAGQNLHGVTAAKPFVAAGISVRTDLLRRATHSLDHRHGDRPAQSARI